MAIRKISTSASVKPAKKARTPAELRQIFDAVLPLLKPYIGGTVVVRSKLETRVELYSETPLVDNLGKARKEMMFAALIQQGGHVGFYLMPICTHPDLLDELGPNLRMYLKGKSCFNLVRWDEELAAEVAQALELGAKLYRSIGWMH